MTIELNHIYNIDCFEGLKDIPSKSVDLVVTDPPYWHKKGRGINRETGKAYANGHSPFANSELFSTTGFMMGEMSTFGEEEIDQLLSELTRVCKIPNIYLFCNETQVPYYAMWAERNELMFTIMVWEKPLSIINKNRFSQNLEFIVRIYDYGTALNRLDENEIAEKFGKSILTIIQGSKKITNLRIMIIILHDRSISTETIRPFRWAELRAWDFRQNAMTK